MLSSQQSKLQNQVATGQSITQPEDDPAAVGRVLNLETEQRHITQHGGTIACDCDRGRTIFTILLPMSGERALAEASR